MSKKCFNEEIICQIVHTLNGGIKINGDESNAERIKIQENIEALENILDYLFSDVISAMKYADFHNEDDIRDQIYLWLDHHRSII